MIVYAATVCPVNSVDNSITTTSATFWCAFEPIEVFKAADPDPKKQLLGKVRGVATVELPDKVNGDIIDLDTIRTQYLTKSGVFTYEHPRGVINTVGFPTAANIIPYVTEDGRKTRALELEGYMYLNDDLGAAIFYKSKTMKEAGGQRSIGWSLEGPGVVRTADLKQPSRLVRNHEPKAVAICLEPANEYALWSVAASARAAGPQADRADTFVDLWDGTLGLPDAIESARGYVAQIAKSARSVNAPRSHDRNDDRNIALLLKSFPTLSWAQGEQWVAKIRNAVHKVMGHKE